jgi:AcrR family transcriptional regulator
MRVTPETKNATRKRIQEAARELFARQGFEATTTRDIARAARVAVGTLFNYFPTKESIVACLVGEANAGVAEAFAAGPCEALSLEEELFAHVAAALRRLGPYRAYMPAVLETSLSPLASGRADASPRVAHLETVVEIAARHGLREAMSPLALQLYWALYVGVMAFWANDRSPRQEDTLALLDESLAMFVGWLTSQGDGEQARTTGG